MVSRSLFACFFKLFIVIHYLVSADLKVFRVFLLSHVLYLNISYGTIRLKINCLAQSL